MRVVSKYTATLGLPGMPVAMGGTELVPGDNDVPDADWAKAKANDCVKAWLACGLLVEDPGADAADDASAADGAPKARRR